MPAAGPIEGPSLTVFVVTTPLPKSIEHYGPDQQKMMLMVAHRVLHPCRGSCKILLNYFSSSDMQPLWHYYSHPLSETSVNVLALERLRTGIHVHILSFYVCSEAHIDGIMV
jgi:hypothetical protein